MSKLNDLLANLSDKNVTAIREIPPTRERAKVYRMIVLTYANETSSTYPLTQEEYAAYQAKARGTIASK